jgi:hypothetical protein
VDNGNSAQAQITINTSRAIDKGNFAISPKKGVSGVTEFTIEYDSWLATDPIKYDIIFGK